MAERERKCRERRIGDNEGLPDLVHLQRERGQNGRARRGRRTGTWVRAQSVRTSVTSSSSPWSSTVLASGTASTALYRRVHSEPYGLPKRGDSRRHCIEEANDEKAGK